MVSIDRWSICRGTIIAIVVPRSVYSGHIHDKTGGPSIQVVFKTGYPVQYLQAKSSLTKLAQSYFTGTSMHDIIVNKRSLNSNLRNTRLNLTA